MPANVAFDRVERLLLACSRTDPAADCIVELANSLAQQEEWERLVALAAAHGVMPLLHRSLSLACPAGVPEPILAELRLQYYANAVRNSRRAAELVDLARLFAEHQIPVVPYKGPVLAICAYGDLSLRRFSDLDLLIHPADAARASALLAANGYAPLQPLQLSWEAHFAGEEGKTGVDLHWQVTPWPRAFPLDLAQLWHRLRPVAVAGTTLHSFAPEDALLVHCQDSVHDYWQYHWPSLRWICDVAEMLRATPGLDWELLLQQAKALGSLGVLSFCVSLAHLLFDAPLPESVKLRLAADGQVTRLVAMARARLFHELERHPVDPDYDRLRRSFLTLRLREHIPLPAPLATPVLYGLSYPYYWLRRAQPAGQ